MRISSRLVLAASIVLMFVAGAGVALLMPGSAENQAVPVQDVTAAAQPQQPQPQEAPLQEVEPVEVARPAAPPITGAQIAALAATPARERAAELIAERAKAEAEAERRRDDDDDDDDDDDSQADRWDDLHDEIREACDDGRIRGAICRNS